MLAFVWSFEKPYLLLTVYELFSVVIAYFSEVNFEEMKSIRFYTGV